jgi:hypothetical protein
MIDVRVRELCGEKVIEGVAEIDQGDATTVSELREAVGEAFPCVCFLNASICVHVFIDRASLATWTISPKHHAFRCSHSTAAGGRRHSLRDPHGRKGVRSN